MGETRVVTMIQVSTSAWHVRIWGKTWLHALGPGARRTLPDSLRSGTWFGQALIKDSSFPNSCPSICLFEVMVARAAQEACMCCWYQSQMFKSRHESKSHVVIDACTEAVLLFSICVRS